MDDLQTLELPRHVHQADGVYRIVHTLADLEASLADGWHLRPPMLSADPEPVSTDDPAADVVAVMDAVTDEPAQPAKARRR